MMLYQLGDGRIRYRISRLAIRFPPTKQVGPMLRGMRKASSNWLGKIIMATVMGVLIISFGVWGIADIFRGFGQSTLAKVGGTEISTEQFRQIYTDRLQQIADEPDLRARFAAAARLRVESIGGWDEFGRKWDDFLHKLTGIPKSADEPV